MHRTVRAVTRWADRVPWPALVVATAWIALIIARSAALGITWDEAASYLTYVVPRHWTLQPGDYGTLGANHHLLTVWGMIGADAVGIVTPIGLRWTAWIGAVVYAVAALSLARRLAPPHAGSGAGASHGVTTVAVFLLLTSPVYLLDFFSLARGYALALGGSLAALAGVLTAAEQGLTRRRAVGIGGALALAVLGSLTALPLALGVLALVTWLAATTPPRTDQDLVRARRAVWGSWGISVGLALPAVAWALREGFRLRASGSLYWGGSTGFWADTVASLSAALAYGATADVWWVALAWQVGVLVVLGAALGTLGLLARRTTGFRAWSRQPVVLVAGLLGSMGLQSVLQHRLLHTPYPRDRTALLFVPVLLVLALEIWRLGTARSGRVRRAGLVVASVGFVGHSLMVGTWTETREWAESAAVAPMVTWLTAERAPQDAAPPVRLAVTFAYSMPVRFYQRTRHLPWAVTTGAPRTTPSVDYCLKGAREAVTACPTVPAASTVLAWAGDGAVLVGRPASRVAANLTTASETRRRLPGTREDATAAPSWTVVPTTGPAVPATVARDSAPRPPLTPGPGDAFYDVTSRRTGTGEGGESSLVTVETTDAPVLRAMADEQRRAWAGLVMEARPVQIADVPAACRTNTEPPHAGRSR